MYKIMTIVGTRPEIIKLSRVIAELDMYTNHVLVHTGQNYDYELNQIFFEDLEIRKPDYFLEAVKSTVAGTIGFIIEKVDDLIEKIQPDAVLVYGDTNSCLSVIPAKRRKVPVFHMEAGNRCFDERVPEEINRRIVDHSSDINMTLTEHARRYLLSEGLRPEKVFNIGSSMREVLTFYQSKIEASTILSKLEVSPGNYFVVSAHREENIDYDENFRDLIDTLNSVAQGFGKPILFSVHPRTWKRIEAESIHFDPLVRLMKPVGFCDYIRLQKDSFCVISDSGTITEESSVLGFPAIMIRNAHERPEGMDVGTVIMSGLKYDQVKIAIDTVTQQHMEGHRPAIINDYNVPDVSKRVMRIIISYIRYINETVWRKK